LSDAEGNDESSGDYVDEMESPEETLEKALHGQRGKRRACGWPGFGFRRVRWVKKKRRQVMAALY
jgi:hypothetical protein